MLRKIVEIDEEKCDGCGQCIPSCAEGAIALVRGKAVLSSEKLCDGLGACLGECPRGALRVVEREAQAFDEGAVRAREPERPLSLPVVAAMDELAERSERIPMSGCPGARPVAIAPRPARLAVLGPAVHAPLAAPGSRLRHWPVQIALVSPRAPELDGADVLLAADCVPFALADFHARLLEGRRVLVGCPKLDDLRGHLEKLTELFRQRAIRSVTVARMEVPCCGGIAWAAREALRAAGRSVPFRDVVVGIGGEVADG